MTEKRILVVSDSHGHEEGLVRLVDRVGEMENPPDYIFHLGDYSFDGRYLEEHTGISAVCVRGNCDLWGSEEPSLRVVNINGCRIMLTHGHEYRVKSGLLQLSYAAAEQQVRICCFGHTHQRVTAYENGVLLLNPGSLLYPRGGKPGCILLSIDGSGNPSAEFYEI